MSQTRLRKILIALLMMSAVAITSCGDDATSSGASPTTMKETALPTVTGAANAKPTVTMPTEIRRRPL